MQFDDHRLAVLRTDLIVQSGGDAAFCHGPLVCAMQHRVTTRS
jgi:hypothetical protein